MSSFHNAIYPSVRMQIREKKERGIPILAKSIQEIFIPRLEAVSITIILLAAPNIVVAPAKVHVRAAPIQKIGRSSEVPGRRLLIIHFIIWIYIQLHFLVVIKQY